MKIRHCCHCCSFLCDWIIISSSNHPGTRVWVDSCVERCLLFSFYFFLKPTDRLDVVLDGMFSVGRILHTHIRIRTRTHTHSHNLTSLDFLDLFHSVFFQSITCRGCERHAFAIGWLVLLLGLFFFSRLQNVFLVNTVQHLWSWAKPGWEIYCIKSHVFLPEVVKSNTKNKLLKTAKKQNT